MSDWLKTLLGVEDSEIPEGANLAFEFANLPRGTLGLVLLLAALALVAGVFWVYRREGSASPRVKTSLAVLRALVLVCGFLLILEPILAVDQIEQICRDFGRRYRTVSGAAAMSGEDAGGANVIIVAEMGRLLDMYAISDIAIVGGTYKPFGGHNPLEPAAFARPVFFGPHMEDFADIVTEMLAEEAACQVKDADELCRSLQGLIADTTARDNAGKRAYAFIEARQGVTERHLKTIATLFE